MIFSMGSCMGRWPSRHQKFGGAGLRARQAEVGGMRFAFSPYTSSRPTEELFVIEKIN
jgi:hypothetical protein